MVENHFPPGFSRHFICESLNRPGPPSLRHMYVICCEYLHANCHLPAPNENSEWLSTKHCKVASCVVGCMCKALLCALWFVTFTILSPLQILNQLVKQVTINQPYQQTSSSSWGHSSFSPDLLQTSWLTYHRSVDLFLEEGGGRGFKWVNRNELNLEVSEFVSLGTVR